MEVFEILLFAGVACVLIFRLRSVLGRRTGHEPPPARDAFGQGEAFGRTQSAEQSEKIVSLPNKGQASGPDSNDTDEPIEAAGAGATSGALGSGIGAIQAVDPSFDPEQFCVGAQAAFEMIVTSYANNDRETLRPLVSDEVFENFTSAMKTREDAKQNLETTLVAVRSCDLIEANLDGRVAFLTVKLVSEQVNVTRDTEDRIVDGDPNSVAVVTDIWTYARNVRSRNPNWTLVTTDISN